MKFIKNDKQNQLFKKACDIIDSSCQIIVSNTAAGLFAETICASIKLVCYVAADLSYPMSVEELSIVGDNPTIDL